MKVFIVGGLGHIGLTMAAVLDKYYEVTVYDTNEHAIMKWQKEKRAAFFEPGLDTILLKSKIIATKDISLAADADVIIITVGTPIDSYLNPVLKPIFALFNDVLMPILNNQLIILRSTVYPGLTKKLQNLLIRNKKKAKIAFCPERVAGGSMIKELMRLPQIISANDKQTLLKAEKFFTKIGIKVKKLDNTTGGELAKLFTNAYRYIHFAIANQFFMMSHDLGCDFYEIFDAITDDYPRMKNFPKPGFTAGYCLMKDSIQLASSHSSFQLQLAYNAMLVNEFIPLWVFRKVRERFCDLTNITVGLAGMAFKAETDDVRDSLAFRVKKIFENECKRVLCSDPFVVREGFVDMANLINLSDVIIITCNHDDYKYYSFKQPVIDIWNMLGKGVGL